MIDFSRIDYLKEGNEKQRRVYALLHTYAVLEKLQAFEPIVAGTIPINIDTDESDVDILCYWQDKAHFTAVLQEQFGGFQRFDLVSSLVNGVETVMATFQLEEVEVEIFGQNRPTKSQEAYRHMLIEARILAQRGEDFRLKIKELKRQGFKTEPAFAKLLGLQNDPYLELLSYGVE